MKLEELPEVKHDDFMCRCSPEEVKKSNLVREAAYNFYSDRTRLDPSAEGFVNFMLFWLGTEGVVEIAADQWAGVGFRPDGSEKYPAKVEGCYIQCDSVVDGIAAAFVLYAKQGLFEAEMPEAVHSAQNGLERDPETGRVKVLDEEGNVVGEQG